MTMFRGQMRTWLAAGCFVALPAVTLAQPSDRSVTKPHTELQPASEWSKQLLEAFNQCWTEGKPSERTRKLHDLAERTPAQMAYVTRILQQKNDQQSAKVIVALKEVFSTIRRVGWQTEDAPDLQRIIASWSVMAPQLVKVIDAPDLSAYQRRTLEAALVDLAYISRDTVLGSPRARQTWQALVEPVSKLTRHQKTSVRLVALSILEAIGSDARPVNSQVIQCLSDSDCFVRWSAIRTLQAIGIDEAAQQAIAKLQKDDDSQVRQAASTALSASLVTSKEVIATNNVPKLQSVQLPEVKVPEVSLPAMKLPEAKLTELKAPETAQPEQRGAVASNSAGRETVQVPEVKVPEASVSAIQLPESKQAVLKAPEAAASELQEPSSNYPKAQEVKMPDVRVPESRLPEIKQPEMKPPMSLPVVSTTAVKADVLMKSPEAVAVKPERNKPVSVPVPPIPEQPVKPLPVVSKPVQAAPATLPATLPAVPIQQTPVSKPMPDPVPLFGPPTSSEPVKVKPAERIQAVVSNVPVQSVPETNTVSIWLPRLRQGTVEQQVQAAQQLGKLGSAAADAVPALAEALLKSDIAVRREIPMTLAQIGAPAKMAIAVLERCLQDRDTEVKVNAARALLELADK